MSLRSAAFTFSVLLLIACVSTLHPQVLSPSGADGRKGDIRGVVSDSATGERLVGVNVFIPGSSRGAASNMQGFYLIPGVDEGTYRLVASAVGYARRTLAVTVTAGSVVSLDIRLSSYALEQSEVVIRSEGVSAISERGTSIHTITPQEIECLPSVAQPDLLRSLQLLPGITSTSDVSAKFYVRGGTGDQNLILLDGMKIYNPFHAFGLFSVLDPDIIRSAEVYTGAFPAGYGGRLSSVVNVTTKDGNLNRVSGTASINFLSGKLMLDGPIASDNTWLVSGRSSLFGTTINKIIPNPAPATFYDMFFKGTFGTPTGRFGFRGYSSGDDVRPDAPDQPDHSWRNSAYAGVLSALVTDRLYLDATICYSRSELRRIAKEGSTVTPASSTLEELSLRTNLTLFTEEGTTFFNGFEFSFPRIENNLNSGTQTPVTIQGSEVEMWVWSRAVREWGPFRFDLGIHSDLGLLFINKPLWQIFQPRVTISSSLDGNWTAKASYGIFTQNLISVSNEDDLISLFDAWLYLPSNLRPEVAEHYVLALDGNLLPSLALSLQGYTKSYTSLTVFNPGKVFPTDPDYINGSGLAYGAEVLLRYTSTLVDLYGAYAWSKVTVTQDGIPTYAPRYDRRHTIKAIATLHVTDDLDATLRWDYATGYPFTQGGGFYDHLTLSDLGTDPFPSGKGTPRLSLGPKNAARLPAYNRLDVGASYRQGLGGVKVILGVSAINVLDAKNILFYDRLTGKTEYMIGFFPTASLAVEF